MTAHSFRARLGQAKLATKVDIPDFVKEIHFDNKLINLNEKVNSDNKIMYCLKMNQMSY